ncbi:uncharacterized protein F4807DRAFT_464364 [Annulohypoxylon truncatum]|uniref:uncharacterized protein n=1 Tax=Annulohypoxylon truncatum TaxID=327061 RepID=UPI0020079833|nr:uncharacterized protein F4807DRAFT_464364 [Annulohypoxylon truncatum]KAI1205683.1 hypothetical protein F4807DRAFT_464364 [Annulohypoxylon truncatum]
MTTHVSPSHLSGVTDISTPPTLTPNACCRYRMLVTHNTTHTFVTPFTMPIYPYTHIPPDNNDRSFRNLSPRTRIGVGLGLLAWGAVGLHLSDRAEQRYGFTPTEEDEAELAKVFPRITAVDKHDVNDASPISKSSSASENNGNWR